MTYILLSDPFRLPILVLEWVFAIICLELGIIFLNRYRSQEPTFRTSRELSFASLFFGFAVMWFFFIVADFYLANTPELPFLIWNYGSFRDLFLNIGCLSLLICLILFNYLMERYEAYFSGKYIFTASFIILSAIFSVVMFIDIKFPQILFPIVWPILFVVITFYFIKSFRGAKNKWVRLIQFLPLFFMLFLGFNLSSELVVEIFGLNMRLIGSIIQVITIGFLSLFFIKFPQFAEFEWKSKIEELLVMNKGGVCIFHKTFGDKTSHLNEILVSGALLSVDIMLKELTETSTLGTSVIKKKDKTINIYATELLRGVLISTEELNSIKYWLVEFISKIEEIYRNILKKWDGNVEIFAPIDEIANKTFIS